MDSYKYLKEGIFLYMQAILIFGKNTVKTIKYALMRFLWN